MSISAQAASSSALAAHPDFSPELWFLFALVRTGLGTDAAPGRPEGLDWAVFAALVERHRVAPFLQRCATAAVAATCPERVVQRVKTLAAQNTHRALAQAAEQIRLTERLGAAGIDVLTVKGLVLARQLHGGPGGRYVGDIDLVVRLADVSHGDALLQAAGLRRSRPDFPLTPRQTSEYLRLKPEYEYVREQPRLRLELLWRLEGLPAVDELWSRTIMVEVAGRSMRTLPPDLNALYLFQHGARHGWFRLFWLIDVARLMQGTTVDWPSVIAQAAVTGGRRALLQGAALARDLLGVAVPAELSPRPNERRSVRRIVHEAQRQLARRNDRETTLEWFRQAAYRMHIQEGAKAKFAAAAPHLSSPLNWQTCPLPDRWFWVYNFASPVLWAYRRVRRTFSRQ